MIQTKLSPSRLWLLIATIAGLCTSCSDITDSGGRHLFTRWQIPHDVQRRCRRLDREPCLRQGCVDERRPNSRLLKRKQ